jgi:hypothetical protein
MSWQERGLMALMPLLTEQERLECEKIDPQQLSGVLYILLNKCMSTGRINQQQGLDIYKKGFEPLFIAPMPRENIMY